MKKPQSLSRSLRRKNKIIEQCPHTGFYNIYKKSTNGNALFVTSITPLRRSLDPFQPLNP